MSLDVKGQVFNSFKPPAKAGQIVNITVSQSLKDTKKTETASDDEERLSLTGPNKVSLLVKGPQLTLEPSDILGVYPAPGSEESPDEYLPHVALAGHTLPWERHGPAPGLPWMALLLISDSELAGGPVRRAPSGDGGGRLLPITLAAGKLEATTVGKIKASDPVTHERLTRPMSDPKAPGLGLSDSTEFFAAHLPNNILQSILPAGGASTTDPGSGLPTGKKAVVGVELLSLLCHVKRTLVDGKVQDSSIVICNRLPDAGDPKDAAEPENYTALLVSLERRSDLLDSERFKNVNKATTFIVLHHWSFRPSDGGDFEEVMKLIRLRPNGGVLRFGNLPRARSPREQGGAPLTGDFAAVLDKDGYFIEPVAGTARRGGVAFRGPLRPFPTGKRQGGFAVRAAPEEFADASGQADYSYAAAFELGRLMALADATVLEELRNISGYTVRVVDKELISDVPDVFQMPDWVSNPAWEQNPWSIRQKSMVKPETEFTKNDAVVADFTGVEHLAAGQHIAAGLTKMSVVNEVAKIGAPAIRAVEQIDIMVETGPNLSVEFGDLINAANP